MCSHLPRKSRAAVYNPKPWDAEIVELNLRSACPFLKTTAIWIEYKNNKQNNHLCIRIFGIGLSNLYFVSHIPLNVINPKFEATQCLTNFPVLWKCKTFISPLSSDRQISLPQQQDLIPFSCKELDMAYWSSRMLSKCHQLWKPSSFLVFSHVSC